MCPPHPHPKERGWNVCLCLIFCVSCWNWNALPDSERGLLGERGRSATAVHQERPQSDFLVKSSSVLRMGKESCGFPEDRWAKAPQMDELLDSSLSELPGRCWSLGEWASCLGAQVAHRIASLCLEESFGETEEHLPLSPFSSTAACMPWRLGIWLLDKSHGMDSRA